MITVGINNEKHSIVEQSNEGLFRRTSETSDLSMKFLLSCQVQEGDSWDDSDG